MIIFDSERDKFIEKFKAGSFNERSSAPSEAQLFMNLQINRAKDFLGRHRDVRIFPAGGGD